MIYILHGEDEVKSRAMILNQQKKLGFENRVDLDENQTTPSNLQNHILQRDIFDKPNYVVFDISATSKFSIDEYEKVLSNVPDDAVLVIYSNKPLPKNHAIIKNASLYKAKVIENEISPTSNIFKFLDYVFQKNRVLTYKELVKLRIDGHEDGQIFSMMLYQLRNIAYAKYDSDSYKKLQPFQKSKYDALSKNYSDKSLQNLYREFYNIDKGTKTGTIDPDMMITIAIEKIVNS